MSRALAFVIAISIVLPVWASDKLISINPTQRAALRIATAPITAHAGAIGVGMPATVIVPPGQEHIVAAPVAGLITAVQASPGDTVRAGQALAVLRSEAIVAGQREVAQTASQLQLAETVAERDAALFKEGIIPESRLQAAHAARAQARAAMAERRAWLRLIGLSAKDIQAVERGERLVDSVTLTAPIAGVVLERSAVPGARVEAAVPLFRVARLDPLWLEIQAPAEVAALAKRGQKVVVPGRRAEGTLTAVGRSVGAAQTVTLRAEIRDPQGELRLNQNVEARIEGLAGAKQWRVSARAIVRHQGQSYVFVERPGGFEPEPVKVLSQQAQSAALDGAFAGDEQVVVEGVSALKAAWQGMGGE